MNRTGLCIQMLQILYARRDYVSRNELAELLETNKRNISEFKKELEVAGYVITSTSGKYGGYKLQVENLFPSLTLDDREKRSVQEALEYLKNERQFVYYDSFSMAMSKLNAKLKNPMTSSMQYMQQGSAYSKNENQMFDRISYARDFLHPIIFRYRSLKEEEYHVRKIEPYEIISNKDGMYILGYDRSAGKTRDYKFFKISDDRMQDVQILSAVFTRDGYFDVKEYVGKNALFKDLHEIELKVTGTQARLLQETKIENIIDKEYKDGILHIHFLMEGKYQVKKFILSLGKECEVLRPLSLKEEIQEEIRNMLENYK